jgi:hypothetical protein
VDGNTTETGVACSPDRLRKSADGYGDPAYKWTIGYSNRCYLWYISLQISALKPKEGLHGTIR